MWSARALAAIVVIVSVLSATPAHGQTPTSDIPYVLASPPSQFDWGCFGACACPVQVEAPLLGGFVLHPSHSDALYTYYDVLDVRWNAPGGSAPVHITGSGGYRRGSEVMLMEQMVLDLSFDGGPPQHFDSGLRSAGATFPEIATRLSLHQEVCRDSVLVVDAKPGAVLDAGGSDEPTKASPFRPLAIGRVMDVEASRLISCCPRSRR